MFLQCPGTASTLLFVRPRDILSSKFDAWPFLTVHFWGERAAGTWRLEVSNAGARNVLKPGGWGFFFCARFF